MNQQLTIVALILAATSGTCRGQVPEVAGLFPDVPPMAALRGVFPGMRVEQLLQIRKAVLAPYIGMHEVVNGDTVEYRVDRPTSIQSEIENSLLGPSKLDPDATVYAIDVWDPTESPNEAEQKWTYHTIALQARTNGMQCFVTKRAGVSRTALAQYGRLWLGVQLIEKRLLRSFGGDVRTVPPIVITFVSTKLEPYVPAEFPREATTCPTRTSD
jgi:hypothetical protein